VRHLGLGLRRCHAHRLARGEAVQSHRDRLQGVRLINDDASRALLLLAVAGRGPNVGACLATSEAVAMLKAITFGGGRCASNRFGGHLVGRRRSRISRGQEPSWCSLPAGCVDTARPESCSSLPSQETSSMRC